VTPGSEPGLECTAYFGPDRGSTASGVHAVVVEVDAETAMARFVRYVVAHDCGKLINPTLVEGQIQGGVAHGIGNCFFEKLVYDENGQLMNASFADYLLPTSLDVPRVGMAHRETPAPMNPMGLKGVGEAGCIPSGAAFAQALEDALDDYELEVLEIPLSPNRLFEMLRDAPRRTRSPQAMETAA
jgi:carbon-monoxide dehydrogenase large subunit